MTRDYEPYTELGRRIEAAKAHGWECLKLNESGWWLCVDPTPIFNGLGQSEWEAWADLLCDPVLWTEIAPTIGMAEFTALPAQKNGFDTNQVSEAIEGANALETAGDE